MTTPTLEGGTPESPLDCHIEPFLKHLRAAGYAERTLRKKRTVAKAFARWTRRKQIVGNDLNDGHIAAFVARSPRRRKAHEKFELAAMRLFFEYLRGYGGLQRPRLQNDVSATDALL
jgi:site-specific recombinase XerD